MSADNGVYIAKFPDRYRITHAQAIENLSYPMSDEEHKEYLESYFGKSKLYKTKEKALLAAHKLAENIEILEYGVSYIGAFEHWKNKCEN